MIGEPLPRLEDAWYQWGKVEDWVLAAKGHGPEWATVFRVGLGDWELLWEAILEAIVGAEIQKVRTPAPFEFTCGMEVLLAFGNRVSMVRLVWHYADSEAAPRLVTAYPTP